MNTEHICLGFLLVSLNSCIIFDNEHSDSGTLDECTSATFLLSYPAQSYKEIVDDPVEFYCVNIISIVECDLELSGLFAVFCIFL